MRPVVIWVLAFAALAACKQNNAVQQTANNAQDLHSQIARFGAMLGETAALTANKPGTGLALASDPKELARALRETVWQFNVQRSQLCARNLYTDVSCGPALEPVWMAEPADAGPSLTELQQRSADVGQEIQKFWGAICDDARRRVTTPSQRQSICPLQ